MQTEATREAGKGRGGDVTSYQRKKIQKRREEWLEEMRGRGLTVMSQMECDALSDMVTLLCLTLRRVWHQKPYCANEEIKQIQVIYDSLKEKQSRCVSSLDFDRQRVALEVPQSDNVILFAEALKGR